MKLRHILFYLGLAALLVALIVNTGRIEQLIQLIHQARWYILTLVLFAQALSYYCNARYYKSFFQIFGYKVRLRRLYEAALVINFVNQVFPTGGISGTSYLSSSLRDEVPVGKATLAQLVRYVFTFISFLVVLGIGFLWLFLGSGLSGVLARLTLLLILGIIFGSLILIVIIGDRPRAERVGQLIARLVNAIAQRFGRRRKTITTGQLEHFFDEFYHGYHLLLGQKRSWLKPLVWSLGGNLAEVATVYVVFAAFAAHLPNPGVVIAAYTLANLLSLLSFFTGGIGLYEGTMIATFVSLGVPFSLAFAVVAVYRTLNLIIFLPFGFYFYRQQLETHG